jgi:hypothetical protein
MGIQAVKRYSGYWAKALFFHESALGGQSGKCWL